VLFWYYFVPALCVRLVFRNCFELFGEGLVVDKGPGVVELVVPGAFEVLHALDELFELLISYEAEEGGIYAVAEGVVGVVVVAVDSVERFGGFAGFWSLVSMVAKWVEWGLCTVKIWISREALVVFFLV